MKYEIPSMLKDAIIRGTWKSPHPDILRRCLGEGLPDMKLFEELDVIRNMPERLHAAGYIDDPEFCFCTGRDATVASSDDPRLSFECALFLGGSVVPGDDVFVAADLSTDPCDPTVVVFDWEQTVPNRWMRRGDLGNLLRKLSAESGR